MPGSVCAGLSGVDPAFNVHASNQLRSDWAARRLVNGAVISSLGPELRNHTHGNYMSANSKVLASVALC